MPHLLPCTRPVTGKILRSILPGSRVGPLGGRKMLSDNENPGAEISAGQSATAATSAPESTIPTAVTEETLPAAAETHDTFPGPVAVEPAAVTVAPAEPVSEPDGPAA